MRKLPKLKDLVEVICPPSIICLECAYWHEDSGCEKGEETTSMAVFGCCDTKKPKSETI